MREKGVYACRFAHGGDTFPLRTTSLLEGSPSLQEAYTKVCPNSAKKITAASTTKKDTSVTFWAERNFFLSYL